MAGIFISCFPIFSPNMSGISESRYMLAYLIYAGIFAGGKTSDS